MTNKKETASASVSDRHSQGQVGNTFRRALENIRKQIEIENYDFPSIAQAEEIALIIAEIYLLPEGCTVQIDGNKLPVEIVREVYGQLSFEHVSEVIARYREIRYEIKHTKTYLRTALYNSVFEIEARSGNDARSSF